MVKLHKKLKVAPSPVRDTRLTRRNLGPKQNAKPETLLVYRRARYYNSQLGQFISRDPLGYVDGMSQYRAYFVPGATDPWGLMIAQEPQLKDGQIDRMTLEAFLERSRKLHPGMSDAGWDSLVSTIKQGCIGLTKCQIGRTDERATTGTCFASKAKAMEFKQRLIDSEGCKFFKNCYGKKSNPVMFAMRFWSGAKTKAEADKLYLPDPKTGLVNMIGYWDRTDQAKPNPEGGTYTNYDFGFYHPLPGGEVMIHATNGHDPVLPTDTIEQRKKRQGPMRVLVSTEAYYFRELKDFDKKIYCVQCQNWTFETTKEPANLIGVGE